MKIRIIGVSGSGKSYLANILSKKTGIPCCELDNIYWDHSNGDFSQKRNEQERLNMYEQEVNKEQWIMEGVYYDWCKNSFEKADIIYLFDLPSRVYKYRIFKRYLKRKLGIEKGKKQTLKGTKRLIKWTDKYKDDFVIIKEQILKPYEQKVVKLTNKKQVDQLIKNIQLNKFTLGNK